MEILVTYSSGYGSTKEVAEKVAEILSHENTFKITTDTIDQVSNIDNYDVIIIGSSVRADLPLANVRDFLARERHVLPQKKVAFFAVCLAATCIDGREEIKREFINPLFEKYPEIHLIQSEAFGGKIDFAKMNPVMQEITKTVLKRKGLPSEDNIDTRDWEFIESWTKMLIEDLKGN